jgi:hypothetical protein
MAKTRKSIEAYIPLARLLSQDHLDSLELLAQEKVDRSLEEPQIEILVEQTPIVELTNDLPPIDQAVAIYPIIDVGIYDEPEDYQK